MEAIKSKDLFFLGLFKTFLPGCKLFQYKETTLLFFLSCLEPTWVLDAQLVLSVDYLVF